MKKTLAASLAAIGLSTALAFSATASIAVADAAESVGVSEASPVDSSAVSDLARPIDDSADDASAAPGPAASVTQAPAATPSSAPADAPVGDASLLHEPSAAADQSVPKGDGATASAGQASEDPTPPTFTSKTPAPGGNYLGDGEVFIDFACEDVESGLAECTLEDHNGEPRAIGEALELPDGRYTWSGTAVNSLGMTTTTRIAFTIGEDTEAPTVTSNWVQPANGWTTMTYLDFSAIDALSGIDGIYIKRGGMTRYISSDYAQFELQLGRQDIEYWAVDRAGNESEHAVIETMVDYERPTIYVDSDIVPTGETLRTVVQNAVVPFAFSCEDRTSGIDECVPDRVSGDPVDTAALGEHEISFYATDVAGNQRTLSIRYMVVADPGNPDPTDPTDPVDPIDPSAPVDPGVPSIPDAPHPTNTGGRAPVGSAGAHGQSTDGRLAATGTDVGWMPVSGAALLVLGVVVLALRWTIARRSRS